MQCHAAGTIRNLAAEDQCVVRKHLYSTFSSSIHCRQTPLPYWYSLSLQAVIEAGCLVTLAEQLRDQRHVPEVVLSETSAAMAVLASHREY